MKVGLIGYRNHAEKLKKILINSKKIKKIKIFVYRKNKNFFYKENEKVEYVYSINELFDSNSIFISSPTSTHKKYIKLFIKKNIFIFCEKPGGKSISDLKFLNSINLKKRGYVYINYNLLFSKYLTLIKKMLKKPKLYGKLTYIDIKITNGISYKKKFSNNWRFTSKNIFDKITGNVGSHYINLLIHLFKSIKKKQIIDMSINKENDTSLIILKAGQNTLVNLYLSYSNPLSDEFNLYFTNAILKIKNNRITIYKPRDCFDRNNNFISPPIKEVGKLNQNNEYLSSLKNSIKFFLMKVEKKSKLPIKYFNNSKKTLKFFI